jgi:hypothetical protein
MTSGFPEVDEFLAQEKMKPKQSPTEADLLAFLKESRFRFPPLQVVAVQREASFARRATLDAELTLRWRDRTFCFGVVARRLWTPKAISEAMDEVRRSVVPTENYPLILVPYLSEEWLLALEAEGISGIDLCGNGVIVVPNELLVLRTGNPNRFRWTGTIKNVYRKNSSIVARTYLLVPQFDSIQVVLEEIGKRGGEITLATVSKACKSLEDDLVIERIMERSGNEASRERPSPFVRRTRLLQPEKLLDLLARNYVPPEVRNSVRIKCTLQPEELRQRLESSAKENGVKVVLTGASSVEAYAVMAREPMQSFYCTGIEGLIQSLGSDLRATDRFANVTLLETRENFVYFDRRPGLIASPIQSYLELLAGDKREKETADQLRRVILGPLEDSRRG